VGLLLNTCSSKMHWTVITASAFAYTQLLRYVCIFIES